MMAYWVVWILYFRRLGLNYAMALAIIPSGIFIFSGILLRDYLLLIFALIFCVGHGYVIYVNNIK